MDNIFLRFPHVTEKIFDQLDNPSLAMCKTVSRPWNNYLNDQKFLYERIMTELAKYKPIGESKKHGNQCSSHYVCAVHAGNPYVSREPCTNGYVQTSWSFSNPRPRPKESWNRILKKLNSKTIAELYNAIKVYIEEATPSDWRERTSYFNDHDIAPLHIAAYIGSVVLYEEIFRESLVQNPESHCGKTPLYIAAGKGHFLLCKTIMETVQAENNVSSGVNKALFEAAKNGHVEVCKFIVDSIDDKNPKVTNGRTPLHVASGNGHLEVCKLIMEKLVDKNPKAEDHSTPLHEAACSGHLEICQLILDNVDDKNPTEINIYVEEEDDPFYLGGKTPLHRAAENGHVEVCKIIIDSIDDKNPKAGTGRTPLHVASENGHLEVCKVIIAQVSDKNPNCESSRTPLHDAAYKGHLEICRLILNNVQDKNFLRDLNGRIHLENAARNGHLETCKLLMSYVEVKEQSSVARDTFNRSKGWHITDFPIMDCTVDPAVDVTRKHMEVNQYLQTYFEDSAPLNEAGPAKRFKSL